MAETTENENIGRVDIFENIDYSDRITVADEAKVVINAPGYKRFFKNNFTNPIEYIFTEGKTRKYKTFAFSFSDHFCGCHFQPFKPEKELVFSLRQVFVHD